MGVIVSKFDGRCKTCGTQIRIGDSVYWQQGVKGVRCLDCIQTSISNGGPGLGAPPPAPGTWGSVNRSQNAAFSSKRFKPRPLHSNYNPSNYQSAMNQAFSQGPLPPGFNYNPTSDSFVPPPPPKPQPRSAPTDASQNTLALAALVALEALIMEMATSCMTPEMDAAWQKYKKLKALALNPGTPGEERAALKQAVLHAVKLAF